VVLAILNPVAQEIEEWSTKTLRAIEDAGNSPYLIGHQLLNRALKSLDSLKYPITQIHSIEDGNFFVSTLDRSSLAMYRLAQIATDSFEHHSIALRLCEHVFELGGTATVSLARLLARNILEKAPNILLVAPNPRDGNAREVTVAIDGSGDFSSVIEAAKHVGRGSIIRVFPGVYTGLITIDTDVQIIGEGRKSDVIFQGDNESAVRVVAGSSSITGVTIISDSKSIFKHDKAGILLLSGSLLINTCTLIWRIGPAIVVSGDGSSAEVRSSTIMDSGAQSILVTDHGMITLQALDIFRPQGAGLEVREYASVNASQVRVQGGRSYGVDASTHSKGLFTDCRVIACSGDGVRLTKASELEFRDCTIRDGNKTGVLVLDHGRGMFERCDIHGNALANVAIAESGNPLLRDCTIRDGNETGVSAHDHGRGMFERCDIHGNALAGVVVRAGGDPSVRDCTIRDGNETGVFVLDHGRGMFERCDIHGNALANVAIAESGNPLLRDCTLRDGSEGGALIRNQGRGVFERCDIHGNALAGVVVRAGGDPSVRDCTIRDGNETGVFVYDHGRGMFERCDIHGNALAGVVVRDGGDPSVRDCTIRDGQDDGVYIGEGGLGFFTNCDIFSNASEGFVINGNPSVNNCIIHHGADDGIWILDNGSGKIIDCKIYGNSGMQVRNFGSNVKFINCEWTEIVEEHNLEEEEEEEEEEEDFSF